MITVNVGEPSNASSGDVWFDPTTKKTKMYYPGPPPYLTWLSIISSNIPTNPHIGLVYVDPLTDIPFSWDGQIWVPAVPANYQFPPTTPVNGDIWFESVQQTYYMYFNSNGWTPLNNITALGPSPGTTFMTTNQSLLPTNIQQPIVCSDITIMGPNNNFLVTIDSTTGNITYGPTYTPDAAAQVFWRALADSSPRFLQSRIDDLVKDLHDVTSRLAVAEGQVLKFKQSGFNVPEPSKPFDPIDAWDRAMGIIK